MTNALIFNKVLVKLQKTLFLVFDFSENWGAGDLQVRMSATELTMKIFKECCFLFFVDAQTYWIQSQLKDLFGLIHVSLKYMFY